MSSRSFGQFASTTQFFLYGKKYCTKSGWEAAKLEYTKPDILESETLSLSGKAYIITGANAGIGHGITSFLAQKGATVYMICRNKERGEVAKNEIVEKTMNNNVYLITADCGLERDVKRAWNEFVEHRTSTNGDVNLEGIICNAGALTNSIVVSDEGVESTFATHLLFGTYLLVNLAIPTLIRNPSARVIVVSSGGMYNTKFPSWDIATGQRGEYDGQMAYAYAKRGQVLLCEQWTAMYPTIKFASCHPGWVDTPGVDSAYGSNKSYLEPLRNNWEGCEGILWLAIVSREEIQGGGFYLDRTPRTKHVAGPFFTEGTFTKNTAYEVFCMMTKLKEWSDSSTRMLTPALPKTNESVLGTPLGAIQRPLDMKKYAGRWYVQADIPLALTKGSVNNIEDYVWNEQTREMEVIFKYSYVEDSGEGNLRFEVTNEKEVLQIGSMANEFNSEWSLSIKMIFYLPLGLRYIIVDLAEDYSYVLVGSADRGMFWLMTRTNRPLNEIEFHGMLEKAADLGYDTSLIARIPMIYDTYNDEAEESKSRK